MKKIPMRRCLGCMESKPKIELLRVVKTTEGQIELDPTGKKNGRGAYICKSINCLEKAVKSKRIEKEFEVSISSEIYESLRSQLDNNDK